MKVEYINYNNRISYCLVYIDDKEKEIYELIDEHLIDIVYGKLESERLNTVTIDEKNECLYEAAKYIYMKTSPKDKVGIVGELLFHAIMRYGKLKNKFISTSPTIGYSDCYQNFYKGFDGCYFGDDRIWLAEIKAKEKKSKNLDYDNKIKVKLASNQLKEEVNDNEINRWNKAKMNVHLQLTEKEINEIDIFSFFSTKKRKEYNQLIGTLIIKDNGNFNCGYIEGYINDLFHENVKNQKIQLVCIRSFDYNMIIEYVKSKYGGIRNDK